MREANQRRRFTLSRPAKGPAWVALLVAGALLVAVAFGVRFPHAPPARELERVVLGFAWPEIQGNVTLASADETRDFAAALAAATKQSVAGVDPKAVKGRLTLTWSDGSTTHLEVTRGYAVFDPASGAVYEGDALRARVEALSRELDARTFGERLTWEQVRPLFPVGGTAEVRDLETGLTFRVHRHRGDAHADVEPLTVEDARTLKRIYGGEWSWKRRAVVVTLGERRVAGSMNGMPHGWGDIFDNEFPGHSCIHFWQSRVHGTWRIDPGHQLMVHKAAGMLAELLDAASPEELAGWAIAAVNQQDVVSLRHMAWPEFPPGEDFYTLFSRVARPVRHLTYIGATLLSAAGSGEAPVRAEGENGAQRGAPPAGEEAGTDADVVERAAVEVHVTAYYYVPDPDQGFPKRFTVELKRRGPGTPWRVDLTSLLPLATPAPPVADAGKAPAEGPPGGAVDMGCSS